MARNLRKNHPKCTPRCITLDEITKERIAKMVPSEYPSLSELIRSLVRAEMERRNKT